MDFQRLFEDGLETDHSSLLLKKIILCIHHGWFRINGCPPNKKFRLAEYLFDNQRIIVDFANLSPDNKQRFVSWFLGPHLLSARDIFEEVILSSDNLGYAIEMQLSLQKKISSYLFRRKNTLEWTINTTNSIKRLTVFESAGGFLIGLKVSTNSHAEEKYLFPDLLNNKRLILTESIVSELLAIDLNLPEYLELLSAPHPYSILLTEAHNLFDEMTEYREKKFLNSKSFKEINMDIWLLEKKFREKDFKWILKKDRISVFYRPHNGSIIILEKKPKLDTMVFSGGLANSYAQIGAYQVIEKACIRPNKFAGSSCGAVLALLCYLGYSAEESLNFFNELRKLPKADTSSLKIAIDYFIQKKISKLIVCSENSSHYKFETKMHISFSTLRALKEEHSICGFADELIITSTDILHKKTQCFSYLSTPHAEVSQAVALAANFPIPFRSTVFDGELFFEDEILSYLPIDLFKKRSSLLETDESSSHSLLAFQVDNKSKKRFFSKFSWLKGIINTSIFFPRKIGSQSHQVFVYPINIQVSSKININEDLEQLLLDSGRAAASRYLDGDYEKFDFNQKKSGIYTYSTFLSIEELLYFCCYRKRTDWLEFFLDNALLLGMSLSAKEKFKQVALKIGDEESVGDIETEVILET